jgi:predicted Zn-dependent peptidase
VRPEIARTRLIVIAATCILAGLLAAAMPAGAQDQPTGAVERRSAGAARIGLMIFPPLLWQPPTVGKEVERHTLRNGIVLYLYPDRTLPLLELAGLFRGGRLYEPPDKAGLTRMAASQIRAGGTASMPPDVLNEELETLAASLELSAGLEALEVRLSVLSKASRRGLQLLAEVLQRPAFDRGQVELARGQLLEEVRRRRDDPRDLVLREFAALHYTPEYPLGAEPTEATLQRIARDDLIAFHRRVVRPDNLMLAVAGDFERDSLIAQLEETLGAWVPDGPLRLPEVPPVPAGAPPGVYLIDKPVPQSSIAVGHLGINRTNPDRHTVELLNLLLGGGGFISRITKRVRSAEGLAYSVGSRYETEGPQPGLFHVTAFTRTAATPDAITAILGEIARLRESPVPGPELDTAKEVLSNSFLFRFTDPLETARQLMLLEFQGLPADHYQTLLGRYHAVTPERLLQAARRYLRPDDLAIVVVGDARALEPMLAPFGPLTRRSTGPAASRAR